MALINDINRKKEELYKLVKDARETLELAQKESRQLDGEDRARWEKMLADAEALRAEVRDMERLDTLEREQIEKPGGSVSLSAPDEVKAKEHDAQVEEARSIAFRAYLRGGKEAAETALLSSPEYRGLQADVATSGGYTMAPQEFVARLLKDMDAMNHIGRLSTKFQLTSSDSMGVPTLDTDPEDHDWTTEVGTTTETTTMAFGKREMQPHKLSKLIKISNKLLAMSALPIEGIVRQRVQFKMGSVLEAAYLVGNGAKKPLGLFIADADGIPTSRDVSAGNITTALRFDGLMAAKSALHSGFNGSWLFSRAAMLTIAQLKDGNGAYLWRQSVVAGEPDTLLGRPYLESEHSSFPQTFTAGLYVGMYADFSYYWTASFMGVQLVRLNELYQENDQTGFISRGYFDGAPVLASAFVRIALAP